jgi:hypothetical protein
MEHELLKVEVTSNTCVNMLWWRFMNGSCWMRVESKGFRYIEATFAADVYV